MTAACQWGAAVVVVSVFAGCVRENRPVYAEFAPIGIDGWDPVRVIPFTPLPLDSNFNRNTHYDLILTVRHSQRGEVREIPITIYEESNDGEISTRKFVIPLRGAKGEPLGRKGLVLYEVNDTIRQNFKLPPGYSITVTSDAPQEMTRVLRGIGMSLIESPK